MRAAETYRQNGRPPRKLPSMSVHALLDAEEHRRAMAKMLLAGGDVSQMALFKINTMIARAILASKPAPGFKDHRWLRAVARAAERRAKR